MTVDELKKYGIEEMRTEEMVRFLETQSTGVLGLPASADPYLLPLSFAFDGESSLFFTYLLGAESRKEMLTEQAETGKFLVYAAETMFNWRSVLLSGRFEAVPPSEWGDLSELFEGVWRPDLFQTANTSRNVTIYKFEITDWSGIKHMGLAPGFEATE